MKPFVYLLLKRNGKWALYLGDHLIIKDGSTMYSHMKARNLAGYNGLKLIKGQLHDTRDLDTRRTQEVRVQSRRRRRNGQFQPARYA